MNEPRLPKKSEALIRVRKEVTRCPKCGDPYDQVEANSHRTAPDSDDLRFYFQFIHGSRECVDFTMASEFEDWIARVPGG